MNVPGSMHPLHAERHSDRTPLQNEGIRVVHSEKKSAAHIARTTGRAARRSACVLSFRLIRLMRSLYNTLRPWVSGGTKPWPAKGLGICVCCVGQLEAYLFRRSTCSDLQKALAVQFAFKRSPESWAGPQTESVHRKTTGSYQRLVFFWQLGMTSIPRNPKWSNISECLRQTFTVETATGMWNPGHPNQSQLQAEFRAQS